MRLGSLQNVFWYLKEQTELFAGQGGYDAKVGAHTQLDAAVIGSRADGDKNRLETGTLGFSDLHNELHFSVQQASASGASRMSASDVMAPALSALSGRNGDDSSTTHAAVSDGALIVRDQNGQPQDVNTLSRDVELYKIEVFTNQIGDVVTVIPKG